MNRPLIWGIFAVLVGLLLQTTTVSAQAPVPRLTGVVTDYSSPSVLRPGDAARLQNIEACVHSQAPRVHTIYMMWVQNMGSYTDPQHFSDEVFAANGLLPDDILVIDIVSNQKLTFKAGGFLTNDFGTISADQEKKERDYITQTIMPKLLSGRNPDRAGSMIAMMEEVRKFLAPNSSSCVNTVVSQAAPPVAPVVERAPRQEPFTSLPLIVAGLLLLLACGLIGVGIWLYFFRKSRHNTLPDDYEAMERRAARTPARPQSSDYNAPEHAYRSRYTPGTAEEQRRSQPVYPSIVVVPSDLFSPPPPPVSRGGYRASDTSVGGYSPPPPSYSPPPPSDTSVGGYGSNSSPSYSPPPPSYSPPPSDTSVGGYGNSSD